jgi:peptidoglycan/xylan/chitin deacetylase (PgdA/CDA1 family)
MKKNSIPILMYHSIASMPIGTVTRGLNVTPKLFNSQMWLLKKLGYRGLGMEELQPYLVGEKQGKVVGITFDDGFRNNLTHALPILKKYGHSATCYIISRKVGETIEWDFNKDTLENTLMNKDEIIEWIDEGMEIGAHTQNHVHLADCDVEIAKQEIQQSRSDLETQFNCPINHFCYPYGSYNNKIVDIVNKAGYKTATTTKKGRVEGKVDLLELPRIVIKNRAVLPLFFMKLFM